MTLGGALDELIAIVAERAGAEPADSYTAALLAAGRAKCAKKLGEEGVEAALAVASGDVAAVTAEAADLLYHIAVALRAVGVPPEAVAAELRRRQGVSGHEEKANRA